MERIGIYGGSFNPVHIGHILAAKQAIQTLRLDKLLMIPAGIAPHKQMPETSASPQQRLEMLKRATAAVPEIQVLDMELRRGGVSYTYQTVEQLREQYPQAQLILIMGTDMFLSFLTWKEPERITAQVSLGVLYRGEKNEVASIERQKALLENREIGVELIENQVTAISSTDLRRMLVFQCAQPFFPTGVGDYIRENALYGTAVDYRNLPMEKLEKTVISLLNPNRVAHVLGCRDTAVQLAQRWGENVTDAARAGILHDITKALDGPLQLTLCSEYGIMLDNFSERNPKTLHALTGSLVAQRIFGENERVVTAIRHHTTGRAGMELLEKIIYVADYMEPNRNFTGVEKLRELAFTQLDDALKLGLEMTLEHLHGQGSEISPETREALEYLYERS